MPTTYRAVINTDDFRKRGMMLPGFTLEVKRRSNKSDIQAIEQLRKALAHHVGLGPDAKAYLEVSDRHGRLTLVRLSAVTTALRTLGDGHCKGPAACNWITQDGAVFASGR
jgi:hypothetical protein